MSIDSQAANQSHLPGLDDSLLKRVLVATLLPLAAYALQLLFWPLLSPHVWLAFFPAVLIAAWLGGFLGGIGATVLSTVLVWWRFIPLEGSFRVPAARVLLSPVFFLLMGFAVSAFAGRLNRLNRRLRQAYRQERFFADVGAILATAALDYEETLTNIARLAVREFANLCFIDLIDESGEVRRLRAASRDPSVVWACEILTSLRLDRNRPHLTAETLKTQLPVLMEQLLPEQIDSFAQGDPERLRALRAIDPKSAITVPLVARRQILGTLAFIASEGSLPFTAKDLKAAEALALRAALSIDNARLYRASQRALDTMARLHGLALLAESGGDLERLLGEVVNAAIAITGADFGNIQLVDPVSSALRIVAHRGFPQWWLEYWNDATAGQGACGASLQRAERVIVENIEQSPIFAGTPSLEIQLKAGIRAVQSTPLVSRSGKAIGMFSTHYGTPRRPDEQALRLLDLLARQAADSIEHAQQSAALRAREEELRQTLETADTGLTRCSRDLRYLSANPAVARIVGLPIERIVGRPIVEVIGTAALETIRPHVERVLRGERVEYEEEIPYSSSGPRYMHVVYTPWRLPSGEIGGWVASISDISESRRAEARERAHLERLDQQLGEIETLYRTAPIGLAMFDCELRCVRINEKMAEINGVPIEATLGRHVREYVPAELADQAEPILRKVCDTGEAVLGVEVQGQTVAGIASFWLVNYHPLRDREGAMSGVQVVVQDISARARAEAALKELNAQLEQRVMERTRELQDSEHRISAILDASSDAMVTIDASGKIITFSRSAVRLFGYSADEAVGQNVRILMPLVERERHGAYLRRYAETRKPHLIGSTRSLSACRKDGVLFPIELTVSEIQHLGLFVGCIRDMTSARALQQEVLSIAMLEQRRIGQELHDGTQQELTGLGLLAQNLSEMIDRQGATQAAEAARRVAAGIAQANAHVRALAHGLIPVPVDADSLPASLDELAHSTEESSGLECRFECRETVRLSDADAATHLFRFAQEAVSNAVKHAGAGMITIRLGQVNGRLTLEIADDGVGIDPRKRPVAGAGLRLMEHRCALVGGHLSVTPRAGGGTVITCAIFAGTGRI